MSRIVVAIGILASGCALSAQTISPPGDPDRKPSIANPAVPPSVDLPNAPSSLKGTSKTDQETQQQSQLSGWVVRDLLIEPDNMPRPKTFDRKFIALNALAVAATIADAELSLNCIRANKCLEGNPLFGKRPTRAKIYAFVVPDAAFLFFLSYHTKGHAPRRKLWMCFPIMASAAHGVAAVHAWLAASGG